MCLCFAIRQEGGDAEKVKNQVVWGRFTEIIIQLVLLRAKSYASKRKASFKRCPRLFYFCPCHGKMNKTLSMSEITPIEMEKVILHEVAELSSVKLLEYKSLY